MWTCVARGSAAALLAALAVVAPARAASPTALVDATAVASCDEARERQQAGELDGAKETYTAVAVKGGDAERACAVAGLKSVAAQREQAAAVVTAGEDLVKAGDLDKAGNVFRSALAMDQSNPGATAGLAQVNKAQDRPGASANWDRFSAYWVMPLGRMLLFGAVGFAVLYALAGLSTRLFVPVDTISWPRPHRWIAGATGFLLIFGAAVMLPLYAMFRPFSPREPLANWAAGALLGIGLGMISLTVLASYSGHRGRREQGDWRDWSALLISLGAAVVVAGALLLAPREALGLEAAGVIAVLGLTAVALIALTATRPHDVRRPLTLLIPLSFAVMVATALVLVPLTDTGRLIAAHIALAVIGVVLTAATMGQNLRLQVEVQKPDGTVSAGSTDYLLARVKGLGAESPKALNGATSGLATTPLSKITSEDLSALPAGKVAGALSRLLFAARPDLTWRARVTLVDADRVAMTLSRNGRYAESAVFSRPDLGLSAVPTEPAEADRAAEQDRANAQLLTGAAAFILLRLSKAHLELQDDLYGAERWQSVALQVIATSRSLMGDGVKADDERVELLSRAMDEDPGYVLARFEYLWAVYRRAPDQRTAHAALANSLDEQYGRSGLSDRGVEDEGWAPLRIRVKYSSATHWLNGYVAEGRRDDQLRENAAESVTELKSLCEEKWKGVQLRRQADRMHDFAENLEHCITALEGVAPPKGATWLHPHEHAPSPKLAWDHACLDCFLAGIPGLKAEKDMRLGQAIEDLEFAVATDRARSKATADPCFGPLASDHRFKQLTGVPPRSFLDLPALAPHKVPLAKAGIESAPDLARRTQSAEQQEQLATHLGVSRVIIDRMREIALLAQVHPDLDDPGMLHLLIAQGVGSPAALRDRASRDADQLISQVRGEAEKYGLTPPGLAWRRRRQWLRAARS
ncbi:DUF4332 domain-containing protein [Streptomyces jumonjinensis]|uniref:DUF4332 domain-containing protein n=1 Tax=Streptomyces jumonjinensis TaxID=1945 RepID=A0A646KFV3_STRJU|nr:DUF4332 domain-containing protein [Streptomyces jumonjinensis]MQT01162.1 DUF4332 domain-containing protein [Streptomyces jumonjinensis]